MRTIVRHRDTAQQNSTIRLGVSVSIPRGTGRHSHTYINGVRNEARANESPHSNTAFTVCSTRLKCQRLSRFTEHCTEVLGRLVLDGEAVSHSVELPSAADGLSRCDLARKQSQAPSRAQPDVCPYPGHRRAAWSRPLESRERCTQPWEPAPRGRRDRESQFG